MNITNQKIENLQKKAKEIRISVLRSLNAAGSGHLGGSLGLTDIFTCLYFDIINHNPKNPKWANRDRLILSIGHVAPVLYASLAHAGYFSIEELLTLRKLGSRLQGHPGKEHGLPGIELSAGSLGQGLSVAVGMALSAKLNKQKHTIYCINGDGELQEGSIWEAAMSAAHYRLDNLIIIIDRNNLQIDGNTEKVMTLEPLVEKWKAFGWEVLNCDGNNIKNILQTIYNAKEINKPCAVIANTLMGKGVPEIENNYKWHGKVPNNEEFLRFLKDIE